MKPSRVLAFILVILVFPSAVWAQQETIYGCAKRANGQLRLVAAGVACLASEYPVQWPTGAAAQSQPPAPAVQGALRVVDQNGEQIGLFVPSSAATRLVGDVWVSIPLTPAGFAISPTPTFAYQSADCSGDAYLSVTLDSMLRRGAVSANSSGQPTFTFGGKPEVDGTTIHSYGDPLNCRSYTPTAPLFGRVTTVDVSMFVAPFKIVQ